ncbi:RlpA-like double-psi beta-barrel-protein domain-containing protein-containing protein [Gilbertella persicaria]|uniref:RlpA-like double-psi beta-barrel-protein domain-containing protein-containing protein n=1 Tax=Gilbertella persicaria TaxID=101096 RepID=UPI0022205381|nr:RlpA-like double-psi beta-barrel-protein domain-containing protein-containing protein [Gilbertella persicaria]KAI8048047.1 RlpA-like double-psi beta-barrel-protein domain-containing protein-containing protein [Gilbertella persicaria]
MKFQFIYLIVLLSLVFVSAQPIERRGLAGKLLKTVKKALFKGVATMFWPKSEGGSQGACGPYADANSQIVAMNHAQYGPMNKKSHWCGKKLRICYGDKCTVATVTDACPTCDHGCLDLTPAVWDQLYHDRAKGVLDVEWSEVGDDDGDDNDKKVEKKHHAVKKASSKHHSSSSHSSGDETDGDETDTDDDEED